MCNAKSPLPFLLFFLSLLRIHSQNSPSSSSRIVSQASSLAYLSLSFVYRFTPAVSCHYNNGRCLLFAVSIVFPAHAMKKPVTHRNTVFSPCVSSSEHLLYLSSESCMHNMAYCLSLPARITREEDSGGIMKCFWGLSCC